MNKLLYLAEFLLIVVVFWAIWKPKKKKEEEKSVPKGMLPATLQEIELFITSLKVKIQDIENSTEQSIKMREEELKNSKADLEKAQQLRDKIKGL